MRYLYEAWKGHNIYFNERIGQFETEKGYQAYVLSYVRHAAVNGF